jgi:AcrR family transcriptional regulator
MILASIEQMIETGPVDFNSGSICDTLGIKHPMVNYYFGSRDGLIAEATVWAYRGWSEKLLSAVRNAAKNAEKRLRAYISAELEWAENMKAMSVMVQYPLMSREVKKIIENSYVAEMQTDFEYHLSILSTLIIELRSGINTDINFDRTNFPRAEYVLKNTREVLDAASFAWSIHGLSTWRSGSHTPSKNLQKEFAAKITEQITLKSHIENVIAVARGR